MIKKNKNNSKEKNNYKNKKETGGRKGGRLTIKLEICVWLG